MTATGTYKNIVVGSDGSKTAETAVAVAAALAKACDARLTVATGWYRKTHEGMSHAEEVAYHEGSPAQQEATWAAETVADAAAIARTAGVEDVHVETPQGAPADTLIDLAEALEDSLIVVGTIGLDSAAERLLGNIPHQLTHHARNDVFLVITANRPVPVSWESVALATDGSPTAQIAVEHGLGLARALGATPTLLTVSRNDDKGRQVLEGVAKSLGDPDDLEQRVIAASDPADGIVAGGRSFDLIVVGNKGMSGPSRLLGSVSNKVTHHVPTDVLLVNSTR